MGGRDSEKEKEGTGGREKSLESRDESKRERRWGKKEGARKAMEGGGKGVIIRPQQGIDRVRGHAGTAH